MTDPAIAAAQRAWAAITHDAQTSPFAVTESAAREALAPLRELHHRNPKLGECMECWRPWPCDTAKLIYPESEL